MVTLAIDFNSNEEINVSVVIEDNFIELGNGMCGDNNETIKGVVNSLMDIAILEERFLDYLRLNNNRLMNMSFQVCLLLILMTKVHLMDDLRTGIKIYVKLQEKTLQGKSILRVF